MNYYKEIEKLIEGKTFKEQMQIIKNYIIFDSPNNVGVYQIENFYIGKSGNILSRITHHIKEVIKAEDTKIVYNKEKLYLIKSALEKGKLTVKHLDKNPKQEVYYIEKLYSTLPLTNIEFVTDKMILARRRTVNKLLKNKKLMFISDKFASRYYVCKLVINGFIIIKMAASYEKAKSSLLDYVKHSHKKPRADKKESNSKLKTYISNILKNNIPKH